MGRRRPPHHPVGSPLRGAPARHLHQGPPCRRHVGLPPPPFCHRPHGRARGRRHVLRPLARPPSRPFRPGRLGGDARDLPREGGEGPERDYPGVRGASLRRARLHPRRLPRPLPQPPRLRLLHRAAHSPVGMVPAAQCLRRGEGPLPRRRGHPPRRGSARRDFLGRGPRQARTRRPVRHRARKDGRRMIDPRDLARCRDAIRHGSLSFYTASRLLPARVRDPALALYAFCRLSDDAVDLGCDKTSAVLHLRDRLGLIYEGRPRDAAADRAFAAVIEEHHMPRELPDALLEGLAWDAQWRQYETLSGVFDYSARVAAAVGAMMSVLMGVRDAPALARACDLGNAMQLTNIARDVGEDARAGRLFLPLDWLDEAGIDPERLLAEPRFSPELGGVTARLLLEARRLYRRAAPGVAALPADCRPAIYAAATPGAA